MGNSNEVCLQVNYEVTLWDNEVYIFVPRQKQAGQKHNINIGNKSFESVWNHSCNLGEKKLEID